jgi:NADPH:quinone reductase-like Zn-dependent oxidoreductase
MQAVTYARFGGPEVLGVTEVEAPRPAPGQVRIAVRASGVNPWDWKLRGGMMPSAELPRIDGLEAAGVVDEVGAGVEGAAPGDEVFGFSVGGAAAELAVLDLWAAKPSGAPWEAAGGLPVAAETSVRVFNVLGGVGEGQTLLVNGAAGGVGSVAVQLARARGARVIGTASEANHGFLRELGAEATSYGPGMVERVRALAPGGVDLALDTAGRGGVPDLVALTGDPARVATIADFGAASLGVKVTGGSEGRAPGALEEAAALLGRGALRVEVAAAYPFAQAAEAHRASEAGHVRGKLVLVPR